MNNTIANSPELVHTHKLSELVETARDSISQINARHRELSQLQKKLINYFVLMILAVYVPMRPNPSLIEFLIVVVLVSCFSYLFLLKKIKTYVRQTSSLDSVIFAHKEYKKDFPDGKIEELLEQKYITEDEFKLFEDHAVKLEALSIIYSGKSHTIFCKVWVDILFYVILYSVLLLLLIVNIKSFSSADLLLSILRFVLLWIFYISSLSFWKSTQSLL